MTRQTLIGVLIAIVLVVLSNSLYVVRETQRGVLLKFGEVVDPDLQPGIHVKVPFVNSVRKFDGRILTVDSSPERFFTQEKKALIVDSYAKFRVTDTAKYYTATNGEENRAAGLLSQRINDGLRNQVAVRTVQEVVSGQRDELMQAITSQLNELANEELGVEVIDVRVKKIDLPPDVSEEVTVIEANAFRDAEIIRGNGDAEATRIYAEAFNQDSEFYSFTRSLQAYRETFNAGGDVMLLQPDSQFFQYLRNAEPGE